MVIYSAIGFTVITILILLRIRTPRGIFGPAPADIFDLAARYQPMLRLLDGPDLALLKEAGDPKLLRMTRTRRRRIFRSYLRSLQRDHALLSAQIRTLMVVSTTDRRDLVIALAELQRGFRVAMAVVEVRLFLHWLGIGSVGADSLIQAFERVSRQARALAPHTAVASPAI